jgi:DNA-binding transcriptional MocR family regulator
VRTDRLVELLTPWLTEGPAYAGVAAGIRGLALDGRLSVGTRLPAERQLALALGFSRTTVSAAYDVLRSDGYLRSAAGAGSRVTLPASAPLRPDADPDAPAVVWDLTVAAAPAPPQLLDAVAGATADLRPLLGGYGLHPYGLPALRTAVAVHLSRRGLATAPEQVMVTSGALAAWDLLLRTVTRPGQRALVEQPTYPAALDAVAANHLRPVVLPVSADGWDLPAASADVALLTPDGQNPTGLLAGDAQRRALLAAVDAPVLAVDETFTELVLDGVPHTPMAALDRRVVTLGSMSKAYWSGLRVGWVRAEPPLLTRLAQLRGTVDLSSPVLEQLVAARLLAVAEEGTADRVARLRASREALLAALADRLPDWGLTAPRAGAMLWAQLPAGRSTRLAAHALDLGLRITPGPRFTVDGTADQWLRLPLSVSPDQAADVVAVLAAAYQRTVAGTDTRRLPPRWTA